MIDESKIILCNACGESCTVFDEYGQHMGHYGLIEANPDGGYMSTKLIDLHEYKFSLCENCLVNMFSEFKIPVNEYRITILGIPADADNHDKEILLKIKEDSEYFDTGIVNIQMNWTKFSMKYEKLYEKYKEFKEELNKAIDAETMLEALQ